MKPRSPRFIPAHKFGWPKRAVHRMIVGRMRSGLFSVRVQGLERLRLALDDDPSGILFVANHSCWWDLFLAHYLNEAIPLDGYGMMQHANLSRFGFFRRIGAFSVDRSSPAGVKASIEYAAGLLAKPRTGVWLFPQGRIESNDVRPIVFEKGLRTLARKAGRIRLVTAALRYDFWQDEHPEALIRFGEPTWIERSELPTLLDEWSSRLTVELDALKSDSLSQDPSRFVNVMEGRASMSERYARFRLRVRGLLPSGST